jgi:UDP-2,3-diacylglucosamine pyrophosphatase LpxH
MNNINKKHTYKTIVISDVHLGSAGSKAEEAKAFLKQNSCEMLILNGDIIDGWQLKKYGSWKRKHTGFLRVVLRMMEKENTKVIYIRGNHDDFLDQVMPLVVGKNFQIRQDYILKSGDKKYFITHGDIFDSVTSHMKWLAYVGDVGYTFLLWLNKFYNQFRTFRGLPYFSLSQAIKQKVKQAVNYISDFEEKLAELAKSRNCQGIICGHIHKADNKHIGDIHYLNSGDWVETLSALVESHENEWSLVYFHENANQNSILVNSQNHTWVVAS